MTVPQTYNVPGISCEHCVSAISTQVATVDGVESVDVDIDKKTVTVAGGDAGAIADAIDEAGYDIV